MFVEDIDRAESPSETTEESEIREEETTEQETEADDAEAEGVEDSDTDEGGDEGGDADPEIARILRETGGDPQKLAARYREAQRLAGRKGQQEGEYRHALEAQGFTFDASGKPVPPQKPADTGSAGQDQQTTDNGETDPNGVPIVRDELGIPVYSAETWAAHREAVGDEQANIDQGNWQMWYTAERAQRQQQSRQVQTAQTFHREQLAKIEEQPSEILAQFLPADAAKVATKFYAGKAAEALPGLDPGQLANPELAKFVFYSSIVQSMVEGRFAEELKRFAGESNGNGGNGKTRTRVVSAPEGEGGPARTPAKLSAAAEKARQSGMSVEDAQRYADDNFKFDT